MDSSDRTHRQRRSLPRQTGVLHQVEVPTGRHRVTAEGKGFKAVTTTVEARADDLLVAVMPAYLDGVSSAAPLGHLRVRVATGPEDIQPYRFYRGLLLAGRPTVITSVTYSLLASAFLVAMGLFPIVAAAIFLGRGAIVNACLDRVRSCAQPDLPPGRYRQYLDGAPVPTAAT